MDFDSWWESYCGYARKTLNHTWQEAVKHEHKRLMAWAEDHYWDSLDGDIVVSHLEAYLSDTVKGE